jgi:hypothetical protein
MKDREPTKRKAIHLTYFAKYNFGRRFYDISVYGTANKKHMNKTL